MKSLYIIFLFGCIVSCSSENVVQNEAEIPSAYVSLTKNQYESAKIETEELALRQMSDLIRVNGVIDVPPQNMYSVSAPLGGYLQSTHLLPGMHVRKGEVLAKLEDQQFVNLQQDYLTTQAKLIYAKSEFERQSELNKNQANSDKVFQQAQMEYNSLRISLKALAQKLQMININPLNLNESNLSKEVRIFSSIDGYVSKVNVNIGKYVSPTDVLFELVNPSDVHLNLKVYEKDVAKLQIGQKLFAFTNSNPEKKYLCDIILISQNINPDGTIEVHCHFENYDKRLIPGMYMNAEIELSNSELMTISENSVVNFEGKDYVFMESGKMKYELFPVTIGSKENGFVELVNGRQLESKRIVSNGAYTLLMALKNVDEE